MPIYQRTTQSFILCTLVLLFNVGCSSSSHSYTPRPSAQSTTQPHIIGFVNDVPIFHEDIENDYDELVGRQVLIDLILDLRLNESMSDQGLQITAEDIDYEEQLFIESITKTASTDSTYQLLASIRSSRHLGPTRYPKLLRRNAMLRKLTRAQSSSNQTENEQMRQLATDLLRDAQVTITDRELNWSWMNRP